MYLKHPCAQTCSGYKQAREEALHEVLAAFSAWFEGTRMNQERRRDRLQTNVRA